jgi:hypothetical protein
VGPLVPSLICGPGSRFGGACRPGGESYVCGAPGAGEEASGGPCVSERARRPVSF